MTPIVKRIVTVLLFVFALNTSSSAQPGGGPGGGTKPGVPISGIEILLVLGGIVGVKKIFKVRNRKEQ